MGQPVGPHGFGDGKTLCARPGAEPVGTAEIGHALPVGALVFVQIGVVKLIGDRIAGIA